MQAGMSLVLDAARQSEMLRMKEMLGHHVEVIKEFQEKSQAQHRAQLAERLQALGILPMPTMHPPRADCEPPDCAPPRADCAPPRADCAPPRADCEPPDCEPEDTIPTQVQRTDSRRHPQSRNRQMLDIEGDVRLFNFAEDGLDNHTLKWFFVIQKELLQDWEQNGRGDGFIHNQSTILEAFVKGNLYGLCMPETPEMFKNVTSEDLRFMTSVETGRTYYRFPVFCAVDNNSIDLLWVACRVRRRGLATVLVSLLKERGVSGADYVERAIPFWQRFGTVTHSTSHAQVHF